MSIDDKKPDPQIVRKLVEWYEDDVELETRKQEIDLQRSRLSVQWADADEQGDISLRDDLERRMLELLKLRRKLG